MIRDYQINKNFLLLLTIYACISFAIISSVFVYSKNNYNKEVAKLNAEISTTSDIKAANIDKWIREKSRSVSAISENLSVVMYLTGLKKGYDLDEKLAQEQFIRNYLVSEAKKSGFTDNINKNEVKANIDINSSAALAIFDLKDKIIISHGIQNNILELFKTSFTGSKKDNYFDVIFSDNMQNAYLVFSNPIKKLQGEQNLGYVVGVKKIDQEFFDLLDFPSANQNISTSELVKKDNNKLISLNTKNNSVFETISESSSAENKGTENPNKIITDYNRKSEKVITVAKNIMGDLFLIYSLDEISALKSARIYGKNIVFVTILSLVAVGLLVLLVWRHSASVKFEKVNRELKEQTALLKLVADNQLQSMMLIEMGNIIFVNKPFLTKNDLKLEEVLNKPIANALGHNAATEYNDLSSYDPDSSIIVTKKYEKDGHVEYIQKKSIPVRTEQGTGYLYVENDITQLMKEREKYEHNLNNVIETLIRIIEQRSAYFHNHTSRTTELGIALAETLNVDEKSRKSVEIAAKLCNLYLALLPRDLINKQNALSNEEKKMFEESPYRTIDIIKDLEFDSPVIDTLIQMMEKPDGSGPKKMNDHEIIESAKILRVVNDYVAMTSERPYRNKISSSEAIDILLKQKDTKYSKKVVFALANILERNAV